MTVAPSLMKRLKQHFHYFEFGVQSIFGINGFIWLAPAPPREAGELEEVHDTTDCVDELSRPATH